MDLGAVDLPLFDYGLPPLERLRTPPMASGTFPSLKYARSRLFVDTLRFRIRGPRIHDQSLAFRAVHRLNIIARRANPAKRSPLRRFDFARTDPLTGATERTALAA